MLLRMDTLRAIERGDVTVQFRRWQRPTVKAGGTLLTAIGQLAIDAVELVDTDALGDADARAAGFADREALLLSLDQRGREHPVYRIELRLAGPDPRVALRDRAPAAEELEAVAWRLARMDEVASDGAWTAGTLSIIGRRPGVRAGDLAEELGRPRDAFKRDVRKLKALGLTESLEVGYRLSTRGEAVLSRLDARST